MPCPRPVPLFRTAPNFWCKRKEFNLLFEHTQVKFQDRAPWVNLIFVPEAGANLLGKDLMSELGIEIKVVKSNFNFSLNLMTTQSENQILSHVCNKDGNRWDYKFLQFILP
jgi:hypothetical protein